MRIAIDFDKKVPNANKDVGVVNLAAAGWLHGAMADRDYSRQLHDVEGFFRSFRDILCRSWNNSQ